MNTNTHALARPQPLARPLWDHVAVLVARLRAGLAQRLQGSRQGAGELQAMSDRELRDLGLGRSEIGHALRAGRD